jgi:hypothetical protein
MVHHPQYAPAPILYLAGHLDVIVAACEALLSLQQSAVDPHRILRLEFTAIAHALQVRHDMQEIAAEDSALASQVRLFLAVTDCFEDAAAVSASPPSEAAVHHLIGGRIPVTTLLALAAAMRDVVGVWYPAHIGDDAELSPVPISEALVWATNPEGA